MVLSRQQLPSFEPLSLFPTTLHNLAYPRDTHNFTPTSVLYQSILHTSFIIIGYSNQTTQYFTMEYYNEKTVLKKTFSDSEDVKTDISGDLKVIKQEPSK